MEAPPPPKRRRWPGRILALLAVLILLGGPLWCGWYVYNRGFTRKWREQLAAELRHRGFDFSARKLTLNPFEGLIAENVRIFLLDEQHTQLIYVDRVAVDIDLIAFIRHKPFLNSLDLRGARLTLPIDVAAGVQPSHKLKLRRLSAKIAFLPDELRLTQAEGEFYGLQLSASGSLRHVDSFNPGITEGNGGDATRHRQILRDVLNEVEKIQPEHGLPRVDIRFQGDLANPSSLRVSTLVQGEALHRGSVRVDKFTARMDYTAGAFHLQQAEIADGHGTLVAQGDFSPDTSEAHFQVQSGIDLPAFSHEFGGPDLPPELELRDTPRLQLEGRVNFATPPTAATRPNPGPTVQPASNDAAANHPPATALQLTGRLWLGKFTYRDFNFERAESDFSWSGGKWYLRGLRIDRPAGGGAPQSLSGDALSEPGACRVRVTTTYDPVPFFRLFPPKVQSLLARTEFRDLPKLELNASGPSFGNLNGWRADGRVTLGHTRYRGAGVNNLRLDLAIADSLITARHITVERDEGTATGDAVTYSLAKHEMRLENLRCNLDLAQVGVWLDPDVYHTIQPFHFRRPPALVMNGNLQFEGGKNSHFVTDVKAPGGMEYVFVHKTLPFTSIEGQVVFNEERLTLNDVYGTIFGGKTHGSLDLALGKGSAHDYTALVEMSGVDFVRLTKLYFAYDTSQGLLNATYRFTGRGDDPKTLHGTGSVTVDHGNVLSIPFLGPLSPMLSVLMPGLGFDEAHQASANFLTNGGKVLVGDMDIRGRGFSLFGRGWLGYTDDTMNFRVWMNTRGLPGLVLTPVSKLLAYSSLGPLSKPVWRPQVLSNAPPLTGEKKEAAGSAQPK